MGPLAGQSALVTGAIITDMEHDTMGDGLAGRYLDINWDLDAKLREIWQAAVAASPVNPGAVSTPE